MAAPKQMFSIAFITTCKGRLHHIEQTLPTLVAEAPAQIILVDYGCPDNTADWVELHFPQVDVVRVKDDSGFCLPRARNMGAAIADATWLCFIDADIEATPGWLTWMTANLDTDHFYLASQDDCQRRPEVAGTFLCTRQAFEAIGGYDEAFRGWGGEDTDIYTRLAELAYLNCASYPHGYVKPITHDDAQRTAFHTIKDVRIQSQINRCYIKTKQYLRRRGIPELSLHSRQHLLTRIGNALSQNRKPPKTFSIHLRPDELTRTNGEPLGFVLEISRLRSFGLFGARKTRIRTRATSLMDRLLRPFGV
ncbi:glycosyltransferase family 2 protein [Pseudomonas fluvialis]|nr:glycosyltransferase family A protein [Pseudomonas fluvialis]